MDLAAGFAEVDRQSGEVCVADDDDVGAYVVVVQQIYRVDR
nr:hypothetical protein [Nocardia jiangxiensis]